MESDPDDFIGYSGDEETPSHPEVSVIDMEPPTACLWNELELSSEAALQYKSGQAVHRGA
jgi:hypothetical protein